MANFKSLGSNRQILWDRFRERARKLSAWTQADLVECDPNDRRPLTKSCVEQLLIAFLTEFGVDFPIDFIRPGPDVARVARQGSFVLGPDAAPVPGFPRPTQDFTFKARDKGFLVINSLDFIAEDPQADDNLRVDYFFSGTRNSVNFQDDQSLSQKGLWKFSGIVLADGDTLRATARNVSPSASIVVSLESDLWMV